MTFQLVCFPGETLSCEMGRDFSSWPSWDVMLHLSPMVAARGLVDLVYRRLFPPEDPILWTWQKWQGFLSYIKPLTQRSRSQKGESLHLSLVYIILIKVFWWQKSLSKLLSMFFPGHWRPVLDLRCPTDWVPTVYTRLGWESKLTQEPVCCALEVAPGLWGPQTEVLRAYKPDKMPAANPNSITVTLSKCLNLNLEEAVSSSVKWRDL